MSQFWNRDAPSDKNKRKGISWLRLLAWFGRVRFLVFLPGWEPFAVPWEVRSARGRVVASPAVAGRFSTGGAAGGRRGATPAVGCGSSAGGATRWVLRPGAGSAAPSEVIVEDGIFGKSLEAAVNLVGTGPRRADRRSLLSLLELVL